MAIILTLAGDTMLGRGVANRLAGRPGGRLFSDELREVFTAADLRVLNLECCVSGRGSRWPSPGKPYFFRAPPQAVAELTRMRVDCVTLANNHALDFGFDAFADTQDLLADAGIAVVGAGRDRTEARAAVVLEARGFRLGVLAMADHPPDFAARVDRPGIAYGDLRGGVPDWLAEQIGRLRADTDAVLVLPHWGPNMYAAPLPHLRAAAAQMVDAGATLVAGSSAHVFQGVGRNGRILHDMGDFIDDYATDEILRNDLGLLFRVTVDRQGVRELAAIPLVLDYCHTRLATGADYLWIRDRFSAACAELGTRVMERDGRLVIGTRDC